MPIKLVHYNDPTPSAPVDNAIFLAGPTSRGNVRTQWRLDAIELLSKAVPSEVEIQVVVPEFEDGNFQAHVEERFGYRVGHAPWGIPRVNEAKCGVLDWESAWLMRARVCLFWLATSDVMPGLTTRAELGLVLGLRPEESIVIGAPPDAVGVDWARFQAGIRGVRFHERLDDVVHIALHNIIEEAPEGDADASGEWSDV